MSNSIAVVVTTPPHSTLTFSAYSYIKTAQELGNDVKGVFFYQDGALNANTQIQIPSDELNMLSYWKELTKEFKTPLHLCITAAEKRGMAEDINIDPDFTVSGLGELVTLTNEATTVIQF